MSLFGRDPLEVGCADLCRRVINRLSVGDKVGGASFSALFTGWFSLA
ncbi:hypothetical protein [Actinokineospora pegani]|nr:hypothetical protein [Actinokineospora pegani]